jgi:uncharacterized protein
MKINVKTCLELKGKTLPMEHTYELPQLLSRNKQLLEIGPVHFSGQGEMQSGIFAVKGTVSGSYTLSCSRCLSELQIEFSTDLEERFNIQAKLSQKLEGEDDDEIHEVVGQEFDLLPYIENEVVISIPYFPSCESEELCKSNLPQEGKDWSILDSEKKEERIDPRLADLAKFFKQD